MVMDLYEEMKRKKIPMDTPIYISVIQALCKVQIKY